MGTPLRLEAEQLIVFVKAPRVGFVKTRLAKRIGSAEAAAAYKLISETLLEQLSCFRDVELRYAPSDAFVEIEPWQRPGWRAQAQIGGNLGERLASAFAQAFENGSERVVIIGSDCPSVTPEDVATAWSALREVDVVLGPAMDGGYWLIGLRRLVPELFRGIPWSTETVFEDTLNRARAAGLGVRVLRTLADIDTESDWLNFLAKRKRGSIKPENPKTERRKH